MALIDIQQIEGLGLPYTAGAEAALEHAALDPMFAAAWDQLLLAFPGVTLQPLFDALPIEELADLVDAVRLEGEEPPNPFVWFTVPCDDAIADTLLAALQTLPFVIYAGIRAPSNGISIASPAMSSRAAALSNALRWASNPSRRRGSTGAPNSGWYATEL